MKGGTLSAFIPISVLAVFILLVPVSVSADPEVCDYQDNDGDGLCFGGDNDGQTCYTAGFNTTECPEGKCIIKDEDFVIQGLRPGVWGCYGENGTCSNYEGEVECLDENTSICSTDPGGIDDRSSPEVCDYTDNDCNGIKDDGFWVQGLRPGVWGCYGENGTCSNYEGEVECLDENTSICSTDPGGIDDRSSPEICDGLDNDCDGTDDNGGNMLCSNWSIAEVATCTYSPDGFDWTWDWFPAFDSVCQGVSGCTAYSGSDPWTDDINHICDITQCSAECEDHTDCAEEEYCYVDGCSCELVGDVNRNEVVDALDLTMVGAAYGSTPGDSHWNEDADIYPKGGDGIVNILDIEEIGYILAG